MVFVWMMEETELKIMLDPEPFRLSASAASCLGLILGFTYGIGSQTKVERIRGTRCLLLHFYFSPLVYGLIHPLRNRTIQPDNKDSPYLP